MPRTCYSAVYALILSLHTATAAAQATLCSPPVAGEIRPSRDLYCIDLSATERGGGASGVVALEYIPGPFTVPVTVEGYYRYALRITLRDLPPPPKGTTYIAWAVTPAMDVVRRLGVVTNGVNRTREIALDRFLVLISAETSRSSSEPHGPVLLRGESPSNRMRPPDLYQLSLGAVMPPAESSGWHGVPMTPHIRMLPSEMALTPAAAPWLPRADGAVGDARSPQPRTLRDGDTLELVAGPVRRSIAGNDVLMYGFNGEQPGPLIVTTQGARITVRLANHLDQPTSIHWHGVRLDNRFDGVPGVTQPVVAPGDTFIYRVQFPDAGIYWYHPHQREDIQQDLGLYGNILVHPAGGDLYGPANREETLILDDLLIGDDGPVAYGSDTPTHALMGRFGNVMLLNGEPHWSARAHRGEVVRFYLTNASNTRTWNVSFEGGSAKTKLVGTDGGAFEREVWAPSVVIGPAERYVVHVRFDTPGRVALVNRVRVLDRLFGRFVPETDTLGVIDVDSERAHPDVATSFDLLAQNPSVEKDIARYARYFDRPPDRQLLLTMEAHGLPFLSERLMMLDSAWFAPVEWGAGMPGMNWSTTGKELRWVLRDPASGRENMDIGWHFHRGDVIKLRIANERAVLHGMQHPIHLHGQRFLVLAVNGKRNDNLDWKDTVLVPSGATVDLLVDVSNPGTWMLHCHIAEHLEAGMMTTITVD
ncbi:MAG TPA: multicopper oxidase domain-containing protein [Gemmatimonadales bacterium]|nr:multicopper oxidase domain-containing protein [Gemmatimonadales bacterium]